MSGTAEEHRQDAKAKVAKSKHRPSRTPTGLPGDEGKPHRHRRQRHKLGEVVDTLLVPEHKAARRLIRRSQKKNPKMASDNNMTLYERIMAYRVLKQKGLGGGGEGEGEGKGATADDDARKLERSDTGWGSVDISQYTNKKDSDDNRTPTPPPTLTQPVRNRSRQGQGHQYDEKLTARDVHVQMDENMNKKEPLPPVRSSTPQDRKTRSPQDRKTRSPSAEGNLSRQSNDLKRHSVLPPIEDNRQSERYETKHEKVQELNSERYEEDHRTREAVVAASTVAAARSDRREDKRDESDIREDKRDESDIREDKRDESDIREDKSKESDRREDRRDESDRREDKRDENTENEKRHEDERRSEKYKEDRKKEDVRQDEEREDVRKEGESEKRRNDKEGNDGYDEDRDDDRNKKSKSPQARQKSRQRRPITPEEEAVDNRRLETPPRQRAPEKFEDKTNQPVVQSAAVAAARGAPQQPRKSSPQQPRRSSPQQPGRSQPQQPGRSSRRIHDDEDDEIARLDRMVDRDLNDIINTLGRKGGKMTNTAPSQADQRLKNKIFNPSFQAEMDNYLRDI